MENENTEIQLIKMLYLGSAPDTLSIFEKSEKIKLIQADTSIEAISYLQMNQDVDAIISETHLPGTDGLSTYKLFKERGICREKPFILVSHQEEPEFFLKSFNEGIDDYYQVPIDFERIYQRIVFLQNRKKELNEDASSEPIKAYKTPFIKRLFDITLAGTALLLLSPLLVLVIIAIKLESKGPFYYVSTRVGANFKKFGFLKFRSMRQGADLLQKQLSHKNQYAKEAVEDTCSECAKLPEGQFCSTPLYDRGVLICEKLYNKKSKKAAFFKMENNPNITKVGKFIRNTSIDELPQLINIIKGDMSIVGNRPLPESEAIELSIDGKASKRFYAAAGLTGLWQVEVRGRGGVMSEETRFQLDAEYAENNSFWGDIKLILRTLKIFIQPGNV